MVDSIYIHEPINTYIGTVMENPDMLKFVPDHLRSKEMGNYAVKKLLFVIRYVLRLKNVRLKNV